MAAPAALVSPAPLVLPPSMSTSPATSGLLLPPPPPATSSSSSSSPCPSAAPSGHALFRAAEVLGCSSGSPGAPPAGGKPVYSTPSPVESTPQNNECKMVEVRGAKVASFTVDGQELICLPQAFELFLKHLVGGLHTVYTKLKRLEITPVVCNVEQVRVLRGLGAIQPGVNRCKLISRRDFDTLYSDCTNASSRPGRPPKRTQSVTSQENPHIMPHSVPGIMSPGIIPPTGLTAAAAAAAANAAIAEAMKVKKIKLEAMSSYHSSNTQHGADSENGDPNSTVGIRTQPHKETLHETPSSCDILLALLLRQNLVTLLRHILIQRSCLFTYFFLGLDLPFMMMPHPLIPVSLPPASVTMAMTQMNHLSTIANMAAAAQVQSAPSRMVTSVIKERVPDSPSPAPSVEDGRRPGSRPSSHRSSSVSSSPAHTESSSDRAPVHQNGLTMNQALLRLSPSVLPTPKEGDLASHDIGHDTKRTQTEKDEALLCNPAMKDGYDRLLLAGQTLPPGFPSPFIFPDGLSSIETLLTNIQGLLKVAIDSARAQEKQVQLEKTELKMELFRERELREALEKQLVVEQKNKAIIQKRLKKEKKTKRKLQEALEYESKRRDQAEQTLKQASSTESLRILNDSLTQEAESDRSSGRTDAERTIQGRRFEETVNLLSAAVPQL
uniref:Dachshund c n=1 Tax=Scleropages formosus TaxID=113540 RepID=A0A8C9VD66_SCLFO